MSSSSHSEDGASPRGAASSIGWLKSLNFTLADVQNGMGPYVALFLQSAVHWNAAAIGLALAIGNVAQVVTQTPVGASATLRDGRATPATGCPWARSRSTLSARLQLPWRIATKEYSLWLRE